MSTELSLTLAFLEQQPAAAARVLQDLDSADAAAFLAQAPARIAAPVLEGMAPWAAASCLEDLDAENAAGLVQAMSTQGGTSILRLLPDAVRTDVMELLPRTAARALGASLSYSRDTVGSWMDHKVPSFPETTEVGEALRYLRTRRRKPPPLLFVVGTNREFVGAVEVGDLLRRNEKARLSEIVDRTVAPLSNRARLSGIAAAPGWDRHNVLPVVGRRKNFLGTLSREQLRAGLSEGRMTVRTGEAVSFLSHLASAYLVTCLGAIEAVTDVGPAESSLLKKGASHDR
ncbi:MAG: CBS domain-containing protein [Alphaproteobacteria bacterium]|nr:CBS domain-containing protein [Alphaproteobacteria bacterium]